MRNRAVNANPAAIISRVSRPEELRDREPADRNDQVRRRISISRSSHEAQFTISCGLAPGRFLRRFARETAADRGEINLRAHHFFRQPGGFFKPAESVLPAVQANGSQRPAREPRGPDHEDDLAHDRTARNRRRMHERTTPAIAQLRDVVRQARRPLRRDGHAPNDGKAKRSRSARC